MAGFSNLYPNLPGMLVEFKDGGMALRTDPTPPETDSLLILGTAIDGPVMEPVAVDINTAEAVFGKDVKANRVPNGSTLIPAFKQAWESGCRDIRLMRVTGSTAKASITKPGVVKTEQVKVEENLGLIAGNDRTVITLAHAPLVQGTVQVTVKGMRVDNYLAVNETDGKVIIDAGAVDAGANVTVAYDYYATADVKDEEVVLDSEHKGTLAMLPVDPALVVVKKGPIVVDPANYTIEGQTITVARYDDTNTPLTGEEVLVSYTGRSSEILHAVESGNGTEPFVTATSEQVIALTETPVVSSVHLYINDAEELTPGAFTVDATAKTIAIKKERYTIGSLIQVSYFKEVTSEVEETIELESIFGGDVYNRGTVEVQNIVNAAGVVIGRQVVITKPDAKKAQVGEEPLVYTSFQYETFSELVTAINEDVRNGVYKAKTDFPGALVSDLDKDLNPTRNFVGGSDGIAVTKEQLFKALSGERDNNGYLIKAGAYQLLEDYQVDWVVPVGVFADDELSGRHDSFAYELGLFCAILSYRNKTTLGAIAMNPCVDTGLAGVQEYAKKLATFNNFYLMRDRAGNIIKDNDGQPIDLGKFLSVVGGPEPVISDSALGIYYGNPAVSYIAMNTAMVPQSAPTNKKLPGVKGLKFRFSNAQLDAITANRIVTFKTKSDRLGRGAEEVFVVDGMTASRIGSDYARLTTSKVVRSTVDQIREVADPFIGEANTVEQKNALAAAISKRLSQLKERGVIVDYAFQIIVTPLDQVLGQAKIELTIVPPQELRKITTVVGLKPSL